MRPVLCFNDILKVKGHFQGHLGLPVGVGMRTIEGAKIWVKHRRKRYKTRQDVYKNLAAKGWIGTIHSIQHHSDHT